MPEINIPGDEIESARNNMQQVLSLFDNAGNAVRDIDAALGNDQQVIGAARQFDDRWSDGRTQLKDEGKSIIDALSKVIDTFTDADNQVGNSLSS